MPIPDRPRVGLVTFDAKDPDTVYPPTEPLRPPAGAPNVLVILLDDVGFGASSAFGGPFRTPVAERLASNGLKFTRFHTTALCSPTRAAPLSGRNHHSVGMGRITEIATSAPGYNSLRPNTAAPLAETLTRAERVRRPRSIAVAPAGRRVPDDGHQPGRRRRWRRERFGATLPATGADQFKIALAALLLGVAGTLILATAGRRRAQPED